MSTWISLARKIACNASGNYRLGVVIVKAGNVLSVAHNLYEPHYSNSIGGNKHAEMRAIRLAEDNCNGATIYISRDNLGISKPCERCRNLIHRHRIAKAVYYDRQGTVITEKINYNES